MAKDSKKIKESPLLQDLMFSGNDLDVIRNVVLEAICKYHNLVDTNRLINNQAEMRYVYHAWERTDELETKLYYCTIQDASEDYIGTNHGVEATLRQPQTIIYTHAYTVITPVDVIERYIRKNYNIDTSTHFELHKRFE